MTKRYGIAIAAALAAAHLGIGAPAEARERHRVPPTNVDAKDMNALVGGRVLVAHPGAYNLPGHAGNNTTRVVYFGPRGSDGTGRYESCGYRVSDRSHSLRERVWWPLYVRQGRREISVMAVYSEKDGRAARKLVWNYNAETGDLVNYLFWQGSYWDNDIGHLQERLPAVVYQLCPDFPPAEELGVQINRAQTAEHYDALIAQDPGRRILRPDLVTEGLRERAGWKGQ